jgi:hypothetical protein
MSVLRLLALRLVGIVGVIGLSVVAALLFLKSAFELPWIVFSSSASPDKSLIAENAMQGDEIAVGRVSVRDQKGTIVYETIFNETLPDLFLKWTDNKHLLVFSNSRWPLPPIVKTRRDATVEVSYATYVQYGAANASKVARTHSILVLKPADISAAFDMKSQSDPWARSCEFQLTGKDGKEFTEIGLTITATVYECAGSQDLVEKHCGSIHSNFKVGQRIDGSENALLTSATVSEIPSYNELPSGAGYRAIRGQFLGATAPLLLQSLSNDIFYIDYNFDFDRRNIKYGVPAAEISEPLAKFKSCIGEQVLWY